nr:MAG TPA: hypothetical protein [Caudoviricetes sp.]
MGAFIEGLVQTPTGRAVPVTVRAEPIPEPGRTPEGNVVVAGSVVSESTEPVLALLRAGKYRFQVFTSTKQLADRELTLVDGQKVTLADIVDAAPLPAPPGGATGLVDAQGHLIAAAPIKVVGSLGEAEALPDGVVYAVPVDVIPPAPGPGPVTPPAPVERTAQVVGHGAGQFAGDRVQIGVDGQAGDRVVVGVNTKAVGDQVFTWPAGWTVLEEPYYIGTMRFTLAIGPWAPSIEVGASKPVEAGYVAVSVRGGGRCVVGEVKDRTKEPVESTTCTAPVVAGGVGLSLGFAFERTLKPETRDQIVVSQGWELVDFVAQEGGNLQTVLAAKWVGAGVPTGMVVTYPNEQGLNGAGVQVVILNA